MRFLLKLLFLLVILVVLYTLFANWKVGNPWTKDALVNQLGVTLGIVEYQSQVIKGVATQETSKVLGEMTKRMGYQPIWQAISGTLSDEAQAVPYNICKPIVEGYESN
jgi:hypothetical protein